MGVQVNLRRVFRVMGVKKAYPIPVRKERLPHDNIVPKFVVEKNNLPQVVMVLGQVHNALQKGATCGNDKTGKLQVP